MKRHVFVYLVLLISALFLAGCAKEQVVQKEEGNLVLSISAVNSEGFDDISITYSKLQIYKSISADENLDEVLEESWKTIIPEQKILSIGPSSQLLVKTVLAPGEYKQMRLNLDKISFTTEQGKQELDLTSSTIRMVRPFTISDGASTKLVLEFVMNESIVYEEGRYNVRPFIKVMEG